MKQKRTLELIEQIKALDGQGLTSREIADKLGMSVTTIYEYKRGLKIEEPKPFDENDLVFPVIEVKGQKYRDVTALYIDCGREYRRDR